MADIWSSSFKCGTLTSWSIWDYSRMIKTRIELNCSFFHLLVIRWWSFQFDCRILVFMQNQHLFLFLFSRDICYIGISTPTPLYMDQAPSCMVPRSIQSWEESLNTFVIFSNALTISAVRIHFNANILITRNANDHVHQESRDSSVSSLRAAMRPRFKRFFKYIKGELEDQLSHCLRLVLDYHFYTDFYCRFEHLLLNFLDTNSHNLGQIQGNIKELTANIIIKHTHLTKPLPSPSFSAKLPYRLSESDICQ